MNRISLAALAAVIASPAFAADLGGHSSGGAFDTPVAGASLTNWSGVYISGSLGRNSTSHDMQGHQNDSSAKFLSDTDYLTRDVYTTTHADSSTCMQGTNTICVPNKNGTVTEFTTDKHTESAYTLMPTGSPIPASLRDNAVNGVALYNAAVNSGYIVPVQKNTDDKFPGLPTGNMGDALLKNGGSAVDYTVDSTELFSFDGAAKGFTGSLGLGYDVMVGRSLLVGIAGDYQFRNAKTTIGDVEFTQSDAIFLGGRLGALPTGNMLVYVLGGYTWLNHDGVAGKLGEHDGTAGHWQKKIGDGPLRGELPAGEYSATYGDGSFGGFTLGAGAETPIAKGLFLGIEGRHTWYGKETLVNWTQTDDTNHTISTGTVTDEPTEWYVGATLKLKLNSGGFNDSLK